MRLVAVTTALLAASQAGAAISPCVIDEMVAAAPTVIQVDGVEVSRPQDRSCTLTGAVARSFSGPFAVGDRVETTFTCVAPDNPGPQFWHDPREVRGAAAVELHIDADGRVAGYSDGLRLLDAPTDAPAREPNCD
jgi:hypothetical protein